MQSPYVLFTAFLACAGAAGAVFHSFNSLDAQAVAYSPEAWHKLRPDVEASGDPGCVLGGLARGLLETALLNQKTEKFVLEELGPPTSRKDAELIYDLGQCHSWGWHNSELVVHMSINGVVLKAQLRASAP